MAANMEDGVVANNGEEMSSDLHELSKTVMDCFWNLAEPVDSMREDAVMSLIAELEKEEKNASKLEKASTLLKYTVDRLVRGLTSPRKAARLGFYVALVEVLRVFGKSVHPSEVVGIIEKVKKSSSTKQDENNNFVGTVIAYCALIRSGRLTGDTSLLSNICKDLIQFSAQKTDCQELCTTLLVSIFSEIDEAVFEEHVWPHLSSLFTCGWETATPDVLWMMLSLTRNNESLVDKQFLLKHWDGKKNLLHQSNIDNICRILMDSTKCHPRVHPVCKAVIREFLNSKHFAVFWQKCVEVASQDQKKEKLYLLFELLKEIMRNLKDAALVKDVFLQPIMANFMKNLVHKEMLLHSAALDLLQAVKDTVISSEDGHFQFAVVECLLKKPNSVMFDQITRTKTISSIVPYFKAEAVASWIVLLKSVFNENIEDKTELEAYSENHRATALNLLAQVFGHRNVQDIKVCTELLKFFALHAFFNELSSSSRKSQSSDGPTKITPHLQQVARSCFHKCLATLPKCVTADSSLEVHCNVLYDGLRYMESLLQKPKKFSLLKPWDDKVEKQFEEILKVLAKLQNKDEKNSAASNKCRAFQLLFLNLGFELFDNVKHSSETFQELTLCCDKALGKHQTSEDEPEWIEVIVDLLLNIVSDNNQQSRHMANNVFTLVTPYLTVNALQQILDVIDPSKTDDENPLLGDDASEEDGSSSSDEDDEEEDEGASERNETLKKSVKAALGNAAADSENDDETYLDDDAMMRVDDSLAEVFRTVVKKKATLSKHDEAQLHFRNRCLDFLTIVTNTKPCISFVLQSIHPLLEAIQLGIRDQTQETLMKKASVCIQQFTKIKKFHHEDTVSREPAEVLEVIVNKFQSLSSSALTHLLCQISMFIMKCALHYDDTQISSNEHKSSKSSSVDKCMAIFKECLQNFFGKRDCYVPAQLFFSLFSKYTDLCWQFSDILLNSSFDANVRLFKRTQALALLIALTSGDLRLQKMVSQASWQTFSTSFLQGATNTIKSMMSSELKLKYLEHILQMMCTVIAFGQKMQTKLTKTEAIKSCVMELQEQPKLSKICKTCVSRISTMLGEPLKHGQKRKTDNDKKLKKKLKTPDETEQLSKKLKTSDETEQLNKKLKTSKETKKLNKKQKTSVKKRQLNKELKTSDEMKQLKKKLKTSNETKQLKKKLKTSNETKQLKKKLKTSDETKHLKKKLNTSGED